MRLIEDVASSRSVAIVGLAKNAGKTECLNYILKRLAELQHPTALTSIGLDGETTDAVSRTPKPEVYVYEDMLFVTSERHYRQRRLTSEILSLSKCSTSLGRLVSGRTLIGGKLLLSGPADTATLRKVISELQSLGANTVLIDGALSRLSPASPAVAESLVLATGASVASSVAEVVRYTRHVCSLMRLPNADSELANKLDVLERGVWGVDSEGNVHDLMIPSAFMLDKCREKVFEYGTTLFCSGAVSDKLLQFLSSQRQICDTTLIMRDFTRMFATPATLSDYRRRGGRLMVLRGNRLLAVCVNPVSPKGYRLDSDRLCSSIAEVVDEPVYNLMDHGHQLNTVA